MEIRVSSASGRGLWMREQCKAGSVLISVKPHIFVLSNQYLDSHCSSCSAPAPPSGLKRCTRCRVVWYCNSTCQTNDWFVHKFECSALQKWAKEAPSEDLSVPSDAVRCLGRILWKRKQEGFASTWAHEIDGLQSHRKSLQPAVFETHTHLAHSIVRYFGLASPAELSEYGLSSAGDLVDVISRFVTNTFALTSPSLTPLGVSVSPLIALINHSCDPNAVIVFPRSSKNLPAEEPMMQVTVIRDIAENEEVLTAYIDTTLPQSLRQVSLKETYDFICQCPFCANCAGVDPREAMWCPKSCGGTCPLPTEENILSRCEKCRAVVSSTDAVIDAIRVGQQALDKATLLQSKDYIKARQLTTNIIPILVSAGLTPSCHPLLALMGLHKSLLVSSLSANLTQEVLGDTIRAAANYATGLAGILREGHPVRGIAFSELGKLLAVDEPAPTSPPRNVAFPPSGPPRLKAAYEALVRARNELIVGFGRDNDGGETGKAVRESAVSLEKELGVWRQGVRNVIEDTPKPTKAK
ncbi:SET domain-containing protein [Leucogyrophana mollusca]|uniref:SET domain-containing protein n=1 Tax=Leucogyrophana mollusca TaxID=85980 RepID=A0ACB8B7J2_9AGAM|nr:SET domain-containing protein [Leucogyrophana mollusca]